VGKEPGGRIGGIVSYAFALSSDVRDNCLPWCGLTFGWLVRGLSSFVVWALLVLTSAGRLGYSRHLGVRTLAAVSRESPLARSARGIVLCTVAVHWIPLGVGRPVAATVYFVSLGGEC